MIIFNNGICVGETEGSLGLYPVFGLVLAVTALLFCLAEIGGAQGGGGGGLFAFLLRSDAGQLFHIVQNAPFIHQLGGLKLAGLGLVFEDKLQTGVDHSLTLQGFQEELQRDVDIGKDFQIRFEALTGAGLFAGIRGLAHAVRRIGDVFALAELKLIHEAVTTRDDRHIFGSILGGAGAQTVEAQRVFVGLAAIVLIFTAGIHLAIDQLPVIALLFLVIIQRYTAAKVLDLDGLVQIAGHVDDVAEAFAGFVDGVGENFKKGVLAAVQTVRTENNARAFPHPIGALQRRNALVAVFLFHFFCHETYSLSVMEGSSK